MVRVDWETLPVVSRSIGGGALFRWIAMASGVNRTWSLTSSASHHLTTRTRRKASLVLIGWSQVRDCGPSILCWSFVQPIRVMFLYASRQSSCGSIYIICCTDTSESVHIVGGLIHRQHLSSARGESIDMWTTYVVKQRNMYPWLPLEAVYWTCLLRYFL